MLHGAVVGAAHHGSKGQKAVEFFLDVFCLPESCTRRDVAQQALQHNELVEQHLCFLPVRLTEPYFIRHFEARNDFNIFFAVFFYFIGIGQKMMFADNLQYFLFEPTMKRPGGRKG